MLCCTCVACLNAYDVIVQELTFCWLSRLNLFSLAVHHRQVRRGHFDDQWHKFNWVWYCCLTVSNLKLYVTRLFTNNPLYHIAVFLLVISNSLWGSQMTDAETRGKLNCCRRGADIEHYSTSICLEENSPNVIVIMPISWLCKFFSVVQILWAICEKMVNAIESRL